MLFSHLFGLIGHFCILKMLICTTILLIINKENVKCLANGHLGAFCSYTNLVILVLVCGSPRRVNIVSCNLLFDLIGHFGILKMAIYIIILLIARKEIPKEHQPLESTRCQPPCSGVI